MAGNSFFEVNPALGIAPDDNDRAIYYCADGCSVDSSNDKVLQAALTLTPRSASPETFSAFPTISASPTTNIIFTATISIPSLSTSNPSTPNLTPALTGNQITAIIPVSFLTAIATGLTLFGRILTLRKSKGQPLQFKLFSIPRFGGVELPGSDARYGMTELPGSVKAPVYEMAAESVEGYGISSQNAVMSGAVGEEVELSGDSGKVGLGIISVTNSGDGSLSWRNVSSSRGDILEESVVLETTAILQRGGSAEESQAKETTAMLSRMSPSPKSDNNRSP